MDRLASLVITALSIAGCAATGATHDGAQRFVGVVDKVNSYNHYEDPPRAFQAFGLIGALIGASIANQGSPTYFYVIDTPEGDVTAQADAQFAVGDCVEISGKPVAGMSRTFGYGNARIERSNKCIKPAR